LEVKKIAILGSTGSIGVQALEIVHKLANSFEVELLTAYKNSKLLAQQVRIFKPKVVVIESEPCQLLIDAANLAKAEIILGVQNIPNAIEKLTLDLVLNALVGFAGFQSSVATLEKGLPLALANKESLVVGGSKLIALAKARGGKIIPVDSEHSAMLQCMVGEDQADINKIIITASGGPFRDKPLSFMQKATVKEALNHPNWSMGAKITIDSATMMNKGLEVIEAFWLFDISLDNIVPVIHPQSIIHSMVEFIDGSSKAQLGPPDMRVPISYAMSFPKRSSYFTPVLDWTKQQSMDFFPMDYEKFPCLSLAKWAVQQNGLETTVLNAANEIAVESFLKEKIRFMDIPKWIEWALERVDAKHELNFENIIEIDRQTRHLLANVQELN
jgi:1-deoxy-D-xylulose-5-phosphate reductoisomerase